jgi:phage gpG-like protein
MQIDAKVDYKDLKQIIKAFSDEYSVKVGLLADKGGNEEVSNNLDLAGLGAVHEFGAQIPVTDKMRGFFRYKFGINLKKSTTHIVIPSRSFLQMPLEKKNKFLKKVKENIGDADDVLYYIKKTGDVESIALVVGASAVDVIQEAFDTSGWGEWEANKEVTISNKGSALPLVDKGYLRSKITYEIEKEK